MSSGVRELRVWQEAVSLAGDVIRTARHGQRRETRTISEAVMMTALTVACLIADGYGRHTSVEQRDAYLAAKRALLRLETELAVARHAELLPAGAFTELTARSGQVARLLAGFLAYLEREVREDALGTRPPPGSETATPGSDRAPA